MLGNVTRLFSNENAPHHPDTSASQAACVNPAALHGSVSAVPTAFHEAEHEHVSSVVTVRRDTPRSGATCLTPSLPSGPPESGPRRLDRLRQ